MNFRLTAIPVDIHAGLELLAAPLLIVAPFALGFSVPAGILSIALGVLLIGLATSAFGGPTGRGVLPLTAHASFDFLIGAVTFATGVLVGFAAGDYAAGLFLVGFASAHLALASATRYSRPAPPTEHLKTYLTQKNSSTHISPPCSTPRKAPLRRGLSCAWVQGIRH